MTLLCTQTFIDQNWFKLGMMIDNAVVDILIIAFVILALIEVTGFKATKDFIVNYFPKLVVDFEWFEDLLLWNFFADEPCVHFKIESWHDDRYRCLHFWNNWFEWPFSSFKVTFIIMGKQKLMDCSLDRFLLLLLLIWIEAGMLLWPVGLVKLMLDKLSTISCQGREPY